MVEMDGSQAFLIFLSICIANRHGFANAVFFEETSSLSVIENDHDTESWVIHKKYHQCSMKNDCNFVVKDIRSKQFSTFENVKDLPSDKEWLRIWKKMEEEGQVVQIANVPDTCKPKSMPQCKLKSVF